MPRLARPRLASPARFDGRMKGLNALLLSESSLGCFAHKTPPPAPPGQSKIRRGISLEITGKYPLMGIFFGRRDNPL